MRGNADSIGNAGPALIKAVARIADASPGAAARLVSAIAPELEHLAIFSRHDRTGGVMQRLPLFRCFAVRSLSGSLLFLRSLMAMFLSPPAGGARHCEEPTGPREVARPDDRLRDEAI